MEYTIERVFWIVSFGLTQSFRRFPAVFQPSTRANGAQENLRPAEESRTNPRAQDCFFFNLLLHLKGELCNIFRRQPFFCAAVRFLF